MKWNFPFRKMRVLLYYKKEGDQIPSYQNPTKNRLTTLDKYPLREVEKMINKSLEWTKAFFSNEKKELIMPAFLTNSRSRNCQIEMLRGR